MSSQRISKAGVRSEVFTAVKLQTSIDLEDGAEENILT
jgi:hypothetical protein